jgi:hypothetical protein
VLLGRLEVSMAQEVRGDPDLLGRAVDQRRHRAVPEQMRPNMPAESLLGADFDLLPDRGAAHRPAVAIEPEVTPDPRLSLAAFKRLHEP